MGVFPYTCEICGGAYERCGNNDCVDDCDGGQFCYETEVVVVVNKKYGKKGRVYDGVYDGYGQVETEDGTIYIPSEFNEFIDDWCVNLTYDPNKTNIIIYCKSCFLKT